MSKNLCLVGNPNVGKTTFFNLITKSFEHTGNWHGVTVDKKEKILSRENQTYNIVDLPGIYSLSSYSFEEQVSIDYLLKENCNVLNIVDSNVLQRNLYLTLQLLEAGFSPTLVVNFANETKAKNIVYDYKKLSNLLGINVAINNYKSHIDAQNDLFDGKFCNKKQSSPLPYLRQLPLKEVLDNLSPLQKQIFEGKENFVAIKLLEQDEFVCSKLNLTPEQKQKLNTISSGQDYLTLIASLRFQFIETLLSSCLKNKSEFVYGKHKIDKFILNKFLCFPIFFAIIFGIFFLTFSSLGAFLSDNLKSFIDAFLGTPLNNFLVHINSPVWVVELVSNGIVSSVGGIISFIPQIVLLFFFLTMLEDSGYISRLSFCMEDLLSKFGLSGKSIFTILMSFGCTTSSILTARTIEDKNTKIKTVIASPYMSCSAKLPIYAVIGGAFFGKGNILIIISLYLLGIIVSLVVSSILNKTILKSGEYSFILEFPPYRAPSIKRVILVIYENCKQFVIKVSTILLSFSVIVWILQNFSFTFAYVPQAQNTKSMLQVVGEFLSPIFAPIGLGSWGIVVSLLVGVMAKEMIVGSMAIINKVPNSPNFDAQLGASFLSGAFAIHFSPQTAIVMMVFSLLYFPCISTLAVMKKEIGFKWTAFACVLQFAVAYFMCLVLYNFLVGSSLSKFIVGTIFCVGVLCALLYAKKNFSKASKCAYCKNKCHKNI